MAEISNELFVPDPIQELVGRIGRSTRIPDNRRALGRAEEGSIDQRGLANRIHGIPASAGSDARGLIMSSWLNATERQVVPQ